MLYGRIVGDQLPSARITGIDAGQARALPGVAAVLTAADVPSNEIVEMASGGLAELEVTMPVLAADRVRYLGEPVALVVAATQHIADEAAELVSIDYEELPGVFDVEAGYRMTKLERMLGDFAEDAAAGLWMYEISGDSLRSLP
jgi:nicotinate dehydrogenase large molybdopterin subunit